MLFFFFAFLSAFSKFPTSITRNYFSILFFAISFILVCFKDCSKNVTIFFIITIKFIIPFNYSLEPMCLINLKIQTLCFTVRTSNSCFQPTSCSTFHKIIYNRCNVDISIVKFNMNQRFVVFTTSLREMSSSLTNVRRVFVKISISPPLQGFFRILQHPFSIDPSILYIFAKFPRVKSPAHQNKINLRYSPS